VGAAFADGAFDFEGVLPGEAEAADEFLAGIGGPLSNRVADAPVSVGVPKRAVLGQRVATLRPSVRTPSITKQPHLVLGERIVRWMPSTQM